MLLRLYHRNGGIIAIWWYVLPGNDINIFSKKLMIKFLKSMWSVERKREVGECSLLNEDFVSVATFSSHNRS